MRRQTRALFDMWCTDYFHHEGNTNLVMVDRFSGWIDVVKTPLGTAASGTTGLVQALRSLFMDRGVPLELSLDGGRKFMSVEMQAFLERWDICHRLSSAYFPQSNGCVEAAVKSEKCILADNTPPSG